MPTRTVESLDTHPAVATASAYQRAHPQHPQAQPVPTGGGGQPASGHATCGAIRETDQLLRHAPSQRHRVVSCESSHPDRAVSTTNGARLACL